MNVDSELVIRMIDDYLAELGTTGLVDARKARDQLMDLRLFFMTSFKELPDVPVS
jgi:hypothetical protein